MFRQTFKKNKKLLWKWCMSFDLWICDHPLRCLFRWKDAWLLLFLYSNWQLRCYSRLHMYFKANTINKNSNIIAWTVMICQGKNSVENNMFLDIECEAHRFQPVNITYFQVVNKRHGSRESCKTIALGPCKLTKVNVNAQ